MREAVVVAVGTVAVGALVLAVELMMLSVLILYLILGIYCVLCPAWDEKSPFSRFMI